MFIIAKQKSLFPLINEDFDKAKNLVTLSNFCYFLCYYLLELLTISYVDKNILLYFLHLYLMMNYTIDQLGFLQITSRQQNIFTLSSVKPT